MADNLQNSRAITTILDIANFFTYFTLGGVIFGGVTMAMKYIIFPSEVGAIMTSVQVYLVLFGYIIMTTQAMMSLNPAPGWSRAFNIEQKRIIHFCMHIVGAVLASAGGILAIARAPRGYSYMTTHGAMGITAMVFPFISLIGGFLNLFSIKQNFLPSHITSILHALCGCLTLSFVFVTYMRHADGDVQ